MSGSMHQGKQPSPEEGMTRESRNATNAVRRIIEPFWDDLPEVVEAEASPVAESPIAESPIAESPIAESPIAESPIAESPIAESPIAESPIAEPKVVPEPGVMERRKTTQAKVSPVIPAAGKNPWVIYGLKDAFYHLGLWIWLLLLGQTAAACSLAFGLPTLLEMSWQIPLVAAITLFLMMDLCVFARLRGRVYSRFNKPLMVIACFTIAPGLLFGALAYLWSLSRVSAL
jgi:hypothetical protein